MKVVGVVVLTMGMVVSANASQGYFGHHNNFNDSKSIATSKSNSGSKSTVDNNIVLDGDDYEAAANPPNLPGYAINYNCGGDITSAGGGSRYFGLSFSRASNFAECEKRLNALACSENLARLAPMLTNERRAEAAVKCLTAGTNLVE